MSTIPNGESLAKDVILACALSPPFAFLFVALRFYTARTILGNIRWDDCKCLPFLTQYGLGWHFSYIVTMGWGLRTFLIISAFPVAFTGNLATLFSKASILLFYLRFSTSRSFNVVIYILLFIITVANSLGALGVLFYCQPISFFWELRGDGTCISGDHWYAWLAILNCVTDGILLVLPAWIIYPLRVGFAQKTAIAAILGTGGFVLGVSIFRMVIIAQGWGNRDYTYKFAPNYIWSVIEINVAIICACAPCLRALVGRYIPSLMHITGRRDPMGIYTIPMSHIAQRLPEGPSAGNHNNGQDKKSTCVASSWVSSKLFGSENSSCSGRDQHMA
ncbi:hypothetical protein MMYC01_208568 [Madurella mycetomatis]|uniref:Rhodopsin domain-containing protein n=1 Tax=Madurella mycetomatis TaxID=100816 RepID=A0A175VS78_9PEZI|nr:hypothetical protein MMYC01_209628 [Madurella mycetomatis]KXX74297.1 hypothetical protein MMYC01_208568 [Madurella mycetomatis]